VRPTGRWVCSVILHNPSRADLFVFSNPPQPIDPDDFSPQTRGSSPDFSFSWEAAGMAFWAVPGSFFKRIPGG